ncbi:[LysW]-lysine hydrolase [Ktedonospora formicarum]|nr:[LysW]-lysine hydrolase [Ktedonospora formicarum]
MSEAHELTTSEEASEQLLADPEVALLHNMLTIPSLSRRESALAHYLVEQAHQRGLYAHVDEVGNFVACTHEELGAQAPIVLLGHMDTVPGNIPVRFEDGLLYGRGAVDAKGPLAAFLCAAARLQRNETPETPVLVIGAVEEESATSKGARAVVERYRPAACVIGEPSGSGAVTIGYKGRLLVECRVERDSAHSAGPERSSNEIAVSFWERVRAHAEQWNAEQANGSPFASLLPSLRSMSSVQNGMDDQATLLIGYRLPPRFDIDGLREQLETWAQSEDVQLHFSGEELAYQGSRATPLARAFGRVLREDGYTPLFKYKTGTSDMNVVGPVWGENIVAYGPGDSSLDHTPNEHISIAEYHHAIGVLEQVLRRWNG